MSCYFKSQIIIKISLYFSYKDSCILNIEDNVNKILISHMFLEAARGIVGMWLLLQGTACQHCNTTRPNEVERELHIPLRQRVCRVFTLCQCVSKCHGRILPALPQPSAILRSLLRTVCMSLTFTKK